MTKEEALELVGEGAILFDELDSAIIGVAETFGMPTVIAYDRHKAIEAIKNSFSGVELDKDDIDNDISIEEKLEGMAIEWFEFNIIGAGLGDYTPVFITLNIN